MTRKRITGILAAFAMAVVGTGVLAAYVRSAEDRALAGEEVVEVLVINKFIEAGATPEEVQAATTLERVPAKVRAESAIVGFDQLAGLVSAVDLLPGEQVVGNRFVAAAVFEEEESTLTAIPPGYHEITIAIEPERAVGGELRPGDSVAVISSFDPIPTNGSAGVRWVAADNLREALDLGIDLETIAAWFGDTSKDETESDGETEGEPSTGLSQVIVDDQEAFLQAAELVIALDGDLPFEARQTPAVTHLLLHKVLVTRVQLEEAPQQIEGEDETPASDLAPSARIFVTLAVPTEDIESVVFSAEFGRIWLSAEPADASETGTQVRNRENIFLDRADDELTPGGDPAFTRKTVGE